MVNPLQVATLAGAATTPGHALSFAYNRKVRGAKEDCRRQGIAFLPIAAESFGGWHGVAEAQVKKLGAALSRNMGQACRGGGGRKAPVGQTGHPAPAGQRGYSGKPGTHTSNSRSEWH